MPATWKAFVEDFVEQYAAQLSPASRDNLLVTLRQVDACLHPASAKSLTQKRLAFFARWLKDIRKCSPETIDQHLSRLARALAWGERNGYLTQAPILPDRVGKRKTYKIPGRALDHQEYLAMLAAAPKVNAGRAQKLVFFLQGLWTGGLRISEMIDLTWQPSKFYVVERDGELMLYITAEMDKGTDDRLMPMPPDFQELLRSVPLCERTGQVFKLTRHKSDATRLIALCAREAGVKVSEGRKTKFASAHDFRRSFATRWASRVMPPELQLLMRHSSLQTTMRHYVTLSAVALSKKLKEVR